MIGLSFHDTAQALGLTWLLSHLAYQLKKKKSDDDLSLSKNPI